MRGVTHSVHGATAGAAVGALSGDVRLIVGGMALGAVAALGPDVDHPAAPAGRVLPPVRWAAAALSWMCGLPSHRGITHTVLAAVVVGAATLPVLPWVLALAVTAGWLAALAGDKVTKTDLPHLWWPFTSADRKHRVRFKALRVRTGGAVEQWVIYPASVALLVVGLAWAIQGAQV